MGYVNKQTVSRVSQRLFDLFIQTRQLNLSISMEDLFRTSPMENGDVIAAFVISS